LWCFMDRRAYSDALKGNRGLAMANRQKTKGRSNTSGGFAGIPRIVMKHPDYINLSGNATKILLELAFQYRGQNNGDLSLSFSVLKQRGFNSKGTVARAIKTLLDARLIIQTREGRFTNPGGVCSLYALTWLPIDECKGKNLTASPTITPVRAFSTGIKTPSPITGLSSAPKQGRQITKDSRQATPSTSKQGRLSVVT